jgi:hypothetical protein
LILLFKQEKRATKNKTDNLIFDENHIKERFLIHRYFAASAFNLYKNKYLLMLIAEEEPLAT